MRLVAFEVDVTGPTALPNVAWGIQLMIPKHTGVHPYFLALDPFRHLSWKQASPLGQAEHGDVILNSRLWGTLALLHVQFVLPSRVLPVVIFFSIQTPLENTSDVDTRYKNKRG